AKAPATAIIENARESFIFVLGLTFGRLCDCPPSPSTEGQSEEGMGTESLWPGNADGPLTTRGAVWAGTCREFAGEKLHVFGARLFSRLFCALSERNRRIDDRSAATSHAES
ncbi:hypothetical protein THAOC_14755, partial [Thalassiosira oceanica]